MKVQALVEFKDYGEAARWLATYCSPYTPGMKLLRQEMAQRGELYDGHEVSTSIVARVAVALLAEKFGPHLAEEVRALRAELEKARAEIARLTGAEPSGGGAS